MSSDTEDHLKTGGAFDVLASVSDDSGDALIGRRIDRYQITELIAEGGMGRVYRGVRDDGRFDRDVAIKVSPASGIDKGLRERFLREQKILASLEHPHIASLLDAGTTDEGLSYFVMQLVPGTDIVSYARTADLSRREIITLLLPVVEAVAYAHAQLIVHRDIKASNILVNEDGAPILLDFGIAKLIDEAAEAATNARPLSLISASPEQLLGRPITAASDVYQVGLLMHQLLLETPAFGERTLADAVRTANDEKPFRLEPQHREQLGRELAAVVSACLQPTARQRYREMAALADDLKRYLGNRPVSVSNPSVGTRTVKLVQRNPLLSAALALLAVVIVGGSTLYAVRINEARLQAEREAETAEEVINFLTTVFETSDPERSRGENVTARQVLDRGAADIETEFADRPIIQARLKHVIAGVYREMGLLDAALPLNESAYQLRTEHLGPYDRGTMISGNDLAILLDRLERPNEAIEILTDVLERQRQTIGSEDPETLKTLNNIGAVYYTAGRFREAVPYLEEALDSRRRILGPDHSEVGSTMTNLGVVYAMLGDSPNAARNFEEAVIFHRRVDGNDSPNTIIALLNLSAFLSNEGYTSDAAPMIREAWDLARRVLKEGHYVYFATGSNVGDLLIRPLYEQRDESSLREALEVAAELQAATEINPAGNQIEAANIAVIRAGVHSHRAEYGDAVRELEEALRIVAATHGDDHWRTWPIRADLAFNRFRQGRYDEAEALYEQVESYYAEENGEGSTDVFEMQIARAQVLLASGAKETALTLAEHASARLVEQLGAEHPRAQRAVRRFERLRSAAIE